MIKLDEKIIENLHRPSVLIVGVGGTGGFVLKELIAFSKVLQQIDRKPLNITICDDDIVMEHNIGKQIFYPSDVGLKKSIVIASRINRTYGTDVSAMEEKLTKKTNLEDYNIIISCVDNISTRTIINDKFRESNYMNYNNHKRYWFDLGNNKDSGQIIMASVKDKLKSIIELNPNLKDKKEDPSCSAYRSLMEQSFAVNRFIATIFINMFSEFFINFKLDYNEIYFNLNKMQITKNKV